MGIGSTSLQQSHRLRGPQSIEYGFGAVDALASVADQQTVERALVVTDENLSEAGVIDGPEDTLASAGVSVEVFDGVAGEPTLSMLTDAAEAVRTGEHDLVVGIGGGSSMDTAKVAAALADTDSDVREILGMGNVASRERGLALLPTTAGTGSEVTHIGVFGDEAADGTKHVVYADPLFADVAIVDPSLTASMPQSVAAATGMDALTHAIECYVSAKRTPYTDVLARNAIERAGRALPKAVHQGEANDEARFEMSLAAMMAGQAFVNAGLGAVHALTYPLSHEFHLGHGLTNALLLPYVMAYNLPAERERYAEVARLLERGQSFDVSARDAVESVIGLLEDIGIPTDIAGYGDLDRADFERFADVAFDQSAHNIERNPRDLDRADIVQIFENAYEGTY